ncbi:hypothetical protein AK812_SmicGene18949 [Symbiodinium microadriaticum]|uniref:Uncharacterized protein n=1 Tax=Symbiodinium microadriaticum TaxID=2951 RepID=A0A1Q9DTZ6_SYMMI|nr:hypothetical protein AK812_SmicGene18949 [Symbiodinium microadriaticum]CAE7473128.1 unnamed protein product [Symbiodinium sp. KB8]CAE7492069.1 unnamed protein product [Symbiodinium microadriaticum]
MRGVCLSTKCEIYRFLDDRSDLDFVNLVTALDRLARESRTAQNRRDPRLQQLLGSLRRALDDPNSLKRTVQTSIFKMVADTDSLAHAALQRGAARAMGKLKWQPSALWEAASLRAMPQRLPELDSRGPSNAAQSVTALRQFRRPLLQALTSNAAVKMAEFDEQAADRSDFHHDVGCYKGVPQAGPGELVVSLRAAILLKVTELQVLRCKSAMQFSRAGDADGEPAKKCSVWTSAKALADGQATLRVRDLLLLDATGAEAVTAISRFNVQGTSNSAWGFTKAIANLVQTNATASTMSEPLTTAVSLQAECAADGMAEASAELRCDAVRRFAMPVCGHCELNVRFSAYAELAAEGFDCEEVVVRDGVALQQAFCGSDGLLLERFFTCYNADGGLNSVSFIFTAESYQRSTWLAVMADASASATAKARAGYQASKNLENIVRKFGELTAEREKRAKTHEEAMEMLVRAQKELDDKEKELKACTLKYEKFMQDLKEKQARRDELREQMDEAKRQMRAFVTSVKDACKKTTYLAEDVKAKYHATERAAERGWSCRQTGNSVLTPRPGVLQTPRTPR